MQWVRQYVTASASMIVCLGLLVHWVLLAPLMTTTVSSEGEVRETVVIIDAGHGGEDCGAIGINGVYEKDINLAISGQLTAYLRAGGITVVETRTDDALLYDPATVQPGHKKSEDLANRAGVAKKYENALFISIHMNSFPIEKYSGLQVWYTVGDEDAMRLATEIQTGVREHLQGENQRVVKPSNGNMYLLDHATCPSILIECGFLTNLAECEKLSSEAYQKELSFVLFCVIMNYLKTQEQGMT